MYTHGSSYGRGRRYFPRMWTTGEPNMTSFPQSVERSFPTELISMAQISPRGARAEAERM